MWVASASVTRAGHMLVCWLPGYTVGEFKPGTRFVKQIFTEPIKVLEDGSEIGEKRKRLE